jgi:hypothetical protein
MTHAGILIHPECFYDDEAVYTALGISQGTLARARRAGDLRFVRKGQRTLYLGRWLLAWLEVAEEEPANAD